MEKNLTVREAVVSELLSLGKVDVHVEDISEVVAECIARCIEIKLKPQSKRREYITIIA